MGYNSEVILEKTKNALLLVKNGEAVYERDSVLFDKKQYPFPLISFLLYSALIQNGPLNIMDFGGSLGSTYYQVKDFLTTGACNSWNIIEQPHYVDCGKKYFEDHTLHFFSSVQECNATSRIDFVILSSSVQYLEDPHTFLDELCSYNYKYLLFDRTAFTEGADDRLTVQHVPPEIYDASYPAWFFNEQKFLEHFQTDYVIKGEFASYVEGESVMNIDDKPVGYDKGFFMINKKYA